MKTFKEVIPFLKRNIYLIIIGILLIIIVDLVQLEVPRIIQEAIDGLSNDGFTKNNLKNSALLILGLTVFMTTLRFFWRLFFGD